MKKKLIGILLGIACISAFAACKKGSGANEDGGEHTHALTYVAAREATCSFEGNTECWKCDCGAVFADADGAEQTTWSQVKLATKEHIVEYTPEIEPTCAKGGNLEHWTCTVCATSFTDETCTETIKLSQVILPQASHDLTHHEGIAVMGKENGVKEHWTCSYCEEYFADEEGKRKITQASTILYSAMAIPDFIVEVPVGRDPVVLQLTDTQIIDSAQARSELSQAYQDHWATDRIDDLCFHYLTEVINAANPDFIIITGDVVHGMYDDNGTSLLALIDFMESFQIPWSPIFGNHDNESKMGADWQCAQFEKAEYCLFEQKTLSGNCNYSVGIAQGGELKRVFYMLDTNAVSSASEESLANGHTYGDYCGAKPDQIAWCLEQMQRVIEIAPDVKMSLACHIQPSVFGEAFVEKYNVDISVNKPNFNIDLYEGKEEGDFGYIGKELIGGWDHSKSTFNAMKELGLDSIFVGHVHYNTASVVYEGVRLHYGVKSGEHDRVNAINTTTGEIIEADRVKDGYSPIIGGSIIVLSETDGGMKDVYNYYCADKAGVIKDGKIQWDRFSLKTKTITPKECAMLLKRDE